MAWTVRGLSPIGGTGFSAPVQAGRGVHPDSVQWIPCLFPWGKAAEAQCLPPTPV